MKRSLVILACLFLVLLPLDLTLVRAQVPQQVIDQIAAKVRQYNLGNPRAESPQPNQTPTPRNQGYWQAFEHGWVYWSPATGAHVVKGDIFGKWASLQWEQGQLGFPLMSEGACRSPYSADRYQRFEGGVVYWRAATRETVVYYNPTGFGAGANCSPPVATTPTGAQRARFRITLNGFTCNRPTADDPLQRDGVDDEVYFEADSIVFSRNGNYSNGPMYKTLIYGDSNNRPQRIRAGSGHNILGGNGGFKENDSYPSRTPWARESAPARPTTPPVLTEEAPGWLSLPLYGWQGELIQGENAVLILFSAWESDGRLTPIGGDWLRVYHAGQNLSPDIARLIAAPNDSGLERTINQQYMQAVAAAISMGRGDRPQDRPIGMRSRGGRFHFEPVALLLTYDKAEALSRRRVMLPVYQDSGDGLAQVVEDGTLLPPGVIAINYRDAGELGGDYTLFVQIERLP